MPHIRDIINHWKLKRSRDATASRTLLVRDSLAFQAFHDDTPHFEVYPRMNELSFNDVLNEKHHRPSHSEVKKNGYETFDGENENNCDRPSCSTVLLITLLLIIFVGLPAVYLLDCFDVVSAHWAAEEKHLTGTFYNQRKHITSEKSEIHYSSNQKIYQRFEQIEPEVLSTTVEPRDTHSNTIKLPPPPKADTKQCKLISDLDKYDCFPESSANQEGCIDRGCCWVPRKSKTKLKRYKNNISVPFCFYPKNYGGYNITKVNDVTVGKEVFMNRTFRSPYPNDVKNVKILFKYESNFILHIQILDEDHNRYQPLYPEVPLVDTSANERYYSVLVDSNKTGFKVFSAFGGAIFDAQDVGALIFSDQFLQLTARLPANINLYGLGQRRSSFQLGTHWQHFTLFNADQPPAENMNLYGSHPLYLAIDESGYSHGVFMLNSNAMEIVIQPTPAITFRPIGGILDLYILTGPTPADVVKQYTQIVGRPFMPPFWSLGFHLCRYGTRTLNHTHEIMKRTQDAGIPLDVQWNDLDYMKRNNDFTYDTEAFADLPAFVKNLHKKGLHWVPIIDAGISAGEPSGTYFPFDKGTAMDIFVKNNTDQPFIGKVWNTKSTVWPDFTNPLTVDYWTIMLRSLHNLVPFDGAWIDMNEPSNFLSGSATGCPKSPLEDPPYLPTVNGGMLRFKTMCMTAKHSAGDHYNVHNLYGLTEAIVTSFAMAQIRGKRPFVISRSTFLGHGHYAGHWSGDVYSNWYDMKKSVIDIMTFSIFGVPLTGADICGFNGNTTAELCSRWFQLGAFYPFSRNHNTDDAIDQDPVALGELVVKSARKSLLTRYSLLPYLYTLFWRAHVDGSTVIRPLYFEFWKDIRTYNIENQFLWGSSLMVLPVLEQGLTKIQVYLPEDIWYNFYTGEIIHTNNSIASLNAPEDTIPLLIRGGYILPMQIPDVTTALTRANSVKLLAALDKNGDATGELYWDDGDSLTIDSSNQTLINMTIKSNVNSGTLICTQLYNGYKQIPLLKQVSIYGINNIVKTVLVNNRSTQFSYNAAEKVLTIRPINISLVSTLVTITWK